MGKGQKGRGKGNTGGRRNQSHHKPRVYSDHPVAEEEDVIEKEHEGETQFDDNEEEGSGDELLAIPPNELKVKLFMWEFGQNDPKR